MGRFGKKRIGLLTPAGNTTIEDDFARWMPPSVKVHVNRLYTGSPGNPNTPQGLLTGLQEMGDSVEEPARWLASAMVDVIAFGCTGGSFLNGPGYDREIAERISAAGGGTEVVVAAGAVVDALNELGVKRIAVCTPYPEELNERLRCFYTAAGFDIVSFDHVRRLERFRVARLWRGRRRSVWPWGWTGRKLRPSSLVARHLRALAR